MFGSTENADEHDGLAAFCLDLPLAIGANCSVPLTMNALPTLRFVIAALTGCTALLTGCASSNTRVTAYSGPSRPASEVATIPWSDSQREIQILKVDNLPLNASRPDVEILPGMRTLEVTYRPEKTLHSYPERVRFYAQAGHEYTLSAKVVGGKVSDEGVWGGKYEVAVYDMTAAEEVGHTNRRPVEPNLEAVAEIRPPAPGRDWDY